MSDRILEVEDLSVEFRGVEVVHNVSFHVDSFGFTLKTFEN